MNKKDQQFFSAWKDTKHFQNLLDTDWLELVDNEQELLTCVLLDTQTPLERLRKVVQYLKERDILNYNTLSKYPKKEIAKILKEANYIWYNSKARFFGQEISFELANATYEQMLTIKGIGPKLASMWMRIVHDEERPIIDTHVIRFLKERGYNTKNYDNMSIAFKTEAKKLNMSIADLDRQIVADGIRKRRGIK